MLMTHISNISISLEMHMCCRSLLLILTKLLSRIDCLEYVKMNCSLDVLLVFPSNIVAYDLIYVKGHIQDLVDDLHRITYFLRKVGQDLGVTKNKKFKATVCDKK